MKLRWINKAIPDPADDRVMIAVKVLQYYDSSNLNGESHFGWQDVPTEVE